MTIDWVTGSGLLCGLLAGGAARFGRLCTMSAVEDALVARDLRGIKAWSLALALSIAATQALILLGLVDVSTSIYGAANLHILGLLLGGLAFGLGMALVGTCSFGLLVRAGSGDLRAIVSAALLGITAMAVTAGPLSKLREPLLQFGMVSFASLGGPSLTAWLAAALGPAAASGAALVLALVVALWLVLDARMRKRPRLLLGAVGISLAVAMGWLLTGRAVDALELDRPESLSFVAPVGRALLQLMMEPFRNVGFGVMAAAGVVLASLGVALARREFRWEAFDDALEMRRHFVGAVLMGIGGVLALGCTIGQGFTAASTLSVSAPIFIAATLLGAKAGLAYLIEGQAIWRQHS